jgi:hypothetical protein
MEGPRQVGCFTGRLMQFLLHGGIIFMAYLIDIPDNGACFFTCLAYYAIYCEKHSLQKSPILTTDVESTREQLCNFLLANRNLIMIKDEKKPLTVHLYFLANYGPNAVFRKAVHLEDSLHREILCDTFDEYLEVMRNPVAHADEIFVWAASMMFNIRLSVLEHFVPRIEDPNLKTLVEMGYPRTAAEHALQQFSDNLDDAIDFLHKHPPKSSESAVVWRETMETHGLPIVVRLARTGRHFELILPQYAPVELKPKLPPTTRKWIVAAQQMWQEYPKSSASGGAAAVPAKPAQPFRNFSEGGGAAVLELPTHQTNILSTKEMWEKHQQSQGCGNGSAAVLAKPAQPFRNFSAGGGAPAVPHQQHQQQCSFGHSQPPPRKPAYPPSQIVVFDGSNISGLNSEFAFYYAIIPFVKKSGPCTSSFKVTNLTLVKGDLETACEDGVNVFGSFITSEDGSPEDRFRAVGFKLEDGTFVNHTGTAASLSDPTTKDDFVRRVKEKWESSMITSITFARCN